MDDELGAVQDRTFARSQDWVTTWIKFTAERILSYAAEGTAL